MIDARFRPIQIDACGWLPRLPCRRPWDGRPGKNEQPHCIAGFTPYAIMSPGPLPEHPDKAGRRRAPNSSLTTPAMEGRDMS
jgi:hypothetical protein